jgi:adenylyltransferase/sulfurtransferase
VGAITLIDADSVSVTNLHRQVLFGPDDVGKRKVDVAASALGARAPWARITPVDLRLTDANAADALAGHDVVLDCTDTWLSRYIVADATRALGIPLVWGAVQGWFGQVTVFDDRTGLRELFPAEPEADLAVCEGGGVLGTLCGQVGTAMATQAVLVLTGAAQGREAGLRGQLTVLDARTGQWRTIPVAGARDA